jgi:hypothetical protein
VWVSPAGAVSPLHYDTSHSFLLQVRMTLTYSPIMSSVCVSLISVYCRIQPHSTQIDKVTAPPARMWLWRYKVISRIQCTTVSLEALLWFLLQVRGHKRMLFISPEQLYRLYCYPDTHLLRRR